MLCPASWNGIVGLAAREFGLCRVPTDQESDEVECDAATAHPFFSCPSDKLDARNIWVVAPGAWLQRLFGLVGFIPLRDSRAVSAGPVQK